MLSLLGAIPEPLPAAADDLDAIEAALERIEDRTYGDCEECGKPIKKTRLKAIPYTPLCINCASEREQG